MALADRREFDGHAAQAATSGRAEAAPDEPWCSEAVNAQLAVMGEAEEEEADEESEEWCPDDFICPITLERLVDPVTAADGLTYEREALQGWWVRYRWPRQAGPD